jgi:hypothetical protein
MRYHESNTAAYEQRTSNLPTGRQASNIEPQTPHPHFKNSGMALPHVGTS